MTKYYEKHLPCEDDKPLDSLLKNAIRQQYADVFEIMEKQGYFQIGISDGLLKVRACSPISIDENDLYEFNFMLHKAIENWWDANVSVYIKESNNEERQAALLIAENLEKLALWLKQKLNEKDENLRLDPDESVGKNLDAGSFLAG